MIDYDRRQKAGKIIGSGRMEKQNDVVVAQRQKRKGLSWSKEGSLSLAIVTANLPPLPTTRTVYGYGQQSLPVKVRDIRQPKIGQWNLSLQRELPWHLKAQAAYAGSASIGLLAGPTDLNQLTPEVLALGATTLNTLVPNPFLTLPAEQRPAATSILGRPTISVGQLLRPFPQFGNVVSYNMNEAHATYHSLQLRVERRFSDGLLFTAGYTFAKTIDDVSSISAGPTIQNPNYQDYYNRRSNKGLSTFDARHRASSAT